MAKLLPWVSYETPLLVTFKDETVPYKTCNLHPSNFYCYSPAGWLPVHVLSGYARQVIKNHLIQVVK